MDFSKKLNLVGNMRNYYDRERGVKGKISNAFKYV